MRDLPDPSHAPNMGGSDDVGAPRDDRSFRPLRALSAFRSMRCPIGTDTDRAAAILRAGGLVAFATETVYGLGGLALDPRAAARIFEAKQRPRFDPLIVHVADRAQIAPLVSRVPDRFETLARRFWPGPLTLVVPKSALVPDLVTSGLPSVALRIPAHPLALELLARVGCPVAAPSANPFGRISPTCASHVADSLGDRIDYILDGGPCRVGLESTVLDLSGDRPLLLRPGGLPVEEIEQVVGPVERLSSTRNESQVPSHAPLASPGLLDRHYAPTTPLVIVATPSRDLPANRRVGLLLPAPWSEPLPHAAVEVLGANGSLVEAAANFFAALRRLDALGLDTIEALPFPDEGLGRALNDRLRRAAHR